MIGSTQRLLACVLCLACALSACTTSDLGNKSAGEACTRSPQCVHGLVCVQGTCQQPHDAGVGGHNDAGHAVSVDAASKPPLDAHATDDAGK